MPHSFSNVSHYFETLIIVVEIMVSFTKCEIVATEFLDAPNLAFQTFLSGLAMVILLNEVE